MILCLYEIECTIWFLDHEPELRTFCLLAGDSVDSATDFVKKMFGGQWVETESESFGERQCIRVVVNSCARHCHVEAIDIQALYLSGAIPEQCDPHNQPRT